MTVIKPQANDTLLRATIFILVGIVAFAAIALVLLYNRAVAIQHELDETTRAVKALEGESAALQDQVFAIFTSSRVETFAEERGFVKEKSPRYIEVGSARESHALSLGAH